MNENAYYCRTSALVQTVVAALIIMEQMKECAPPYKYPPEAFAGPSQRQAGAAGGGRGSPLLAVVIRGGTAASVCPNLRGVDGHMAWQRKNKCAGIFCRVPHVTPMLSPAPPTTGNCTVPGHILLLKYA